jgi:hypothetical protein
MGLDMYLQRKPRKDEDVDSVDLGYWRKANAIHAYFTRDLEDGEDNMKPVRVSKNDLIDLQERCIKVLAGGPKVAEELLPTASGFFWGDTAYNEWYIKDVQDTLTIVKDVLDDWKPNDRVSYLAWY